VQDSAVYLLHVLCLRCQSFHGFLLNVETIIRRKQGKTRERRDRVGEEEMKRDGVRGMEIERGCRLYKSDWEKS
jgi:hypothetical protein